MQVYDKARELARLIRESEEYRTYSELKGKLYADEKTGLLLDELKKMQFEAQASVLAGRELDAGVMDRIRKIGEVLQFNSDVTAFFAAEYSLHTIAGEVYRIIGEACGIDPGMLQE